MVGFSRERVTAELLALTLLSTFLRKSLGTGSSTVELSGLTVVLNNPVKHRNTVQYLWSGRGIWNVLSVKKSGFKLFSTVPMVT